MNIHTYHHPARSGETGHTFEMDHLYPSKDPRRQALSKISHESIPYKHFADAIVECLEGNPGRFSGTELWDPPTGWLRDVHFAIAERLGVEDYENLVVMPTLKTSADVHHGIDLLVAYREPKNDREIIVTVDLSLRRKERFKADVLVTETDVIPNDWRYAMHETSIPDVPHANKEEEKQTEQWRRAAIGETIAEIIKQKCREEDPRQIATSRGFQARVRSSIAMLLQQKRSA